MLFYHFTEDKVHPRTGATILHVAAAKGYIDVLSAILNNKILRSQVDPNARDNENWTPLAAACYWQHSGAVQLLLLHGADVNVETISGQRLEDLTDHDLILKLIEEKRLAEERKRKEQLKEQIIMNSPQSKGWLSLLNGTESIICKNCSLTLRRLFFVHEGKVLTRQIFNILYIHTSTHIHTYIIAYAFIIIHLVKLIFGRDLTLFHPDEYSG